MFFDQQEFDIRCEWGERGVNVLAPISDVVIIVDVLSFSTCVDIAVARGATVFPYQWRDESAAKFASTIDGQLADPKRTNGKYSLPPESLKCILPGMHIVLPSPNGAKSNISPMTRLKHLKVEMFDYFERARHPFLDA